jgi:predicted aspartyl protease
MGHVMQTVTITGGQARDVEMLVGTGAAYSVLSPALADEIGVARLGRSYRIQLANGAPVEMEVGVALFRVLGREAPASVLIGDVTEPLLGVETLEALGLSVDPTTGTLHKKRGYAVRLGGFR